MNGEAHQLHLHAEIEFHDWLTVRPPISFFDFKVVVLQTFFNFLDFIHHLTFRPGSNSRLHNKLCLKTFGRKVDGG